MRNRFAGVVLLSLLGSGDRPSVGPVQTITRYTGCIVGSVYYPGVNTYRYMAIWKLKSAAVAGTYYMNFKPGRIEFKPGYGFDWMTAAQLSEWAPQIEELRNAANRKVPVEIAYNTESLVTYFNVQYDQSCP